MIFLCLNAQDDIIIGHPIPRRENKAAIKLYARYTAFLRLKQKIKNNNTTNLDLLHFLYPVLFGPCWRQCFFLQNPCRGENPTIRLCTASADVHTLTERAARANGATGFSTCKQTLSRTLIHCPLDVDAWMTNVLIKVRIFFFSFWQPYAPMIIVITN